MQSKYRLNEKYLSNNPLFIEMPFSRGYQFTGGLLILYTMPKRIIFTEIDSTVGSEIEMFLNDKGNVSIVIKYQDDLYADIRVIQLHPDEFTEMIDIINEEIQENISE